MPRYDADWVESMLQPERRGSETPEETIARLHLHSGEVIADVGCGPGYFAIPAARAVSPGGLVYAIDREPRMLDLIRQRAQAAGIANIEAAPADDSIPLENQSVDVAFCSLVLHDLANPMALIQDLFRITRPNGRVAVVEWLPEPGETRPNRISPECLTDFFLTNPNFRTPEVTAIGLRQYLAVFGKCLR